MVTYTSNVAELARETRPGAAIRLDAGAGGRIASTVAGRIADRGARGEGPDGAWDRNARSTIEAKGFDAPNVETGQMLDPAHIAPAGGVASTASEVVITYGTGEAGADGVTDRQRATVAEEGQSARRIRRPFFWLNDGDCDALAELAGDEYDRGAGGGPPMLPGAAGPMRMLPAPGRRGG